MGQRLTESFVHRPKWELYDLQKDPGEARNLAEDSDHASIMAEMKGKLRTWQEKTKDPWVIKYEYE
jgi:N-sulfoglucosamine sulfohydrolase